MVKVLQPFKVTHCHTSSVAENVGQEVNATVNQNFFCLQSSGAISSFDDQFGLELISIAHINSLLEGSWDEEVAFLINS